MGSFTSGAGGGATTAGRVLGPILGPLAGVFGVGGSPAMPQDLLNQLLASNRASELDAHNNAGIITQKVVEQLWQLQAPEGMNPDLWYPDPSTGLPTWIAQTFRSTSGGGTTGIPPDWVRILNTAYYTGMPLAPFLGAIQTQAKSSFTSSQQPQQPQQPEQPAEQPQETKPEEEEKTPGYSGPTISWPDAGGGMPDWAKVVLAGGIGAGAGLGLGSLAGSSPAIGGLPVPSMPGAPAGVTPEGQPTNPNFSTGTTEVLPPPILPVTMPNLAIPEVFQNVPGPPDPFAPPPNLPAQIPPLTLPPVPGPNVPPAPMDGKTPGVWDLLSTALGAMGAGGKAGGGGGLGFPSGGGMPVVGGGGARTLFELPNMMRPQTIPPTLGQLLAMRGGR